jgi:hypothetical protein
VPIPVSAANFCDSVENQAETSRGASLCQSVAQLLLLAVVQRGLQHGAAGVLDFPQHLVRRHVLDEDEQRGVARLQRLREFLHEGIVDPVIRQRASKRAGCRAEGNAEQGIEEDQADQKSPEAARCCSDRRRVDELVQLDGTRFRLHGNHGVAQRDQIFLLQLEQTLPYLFGLGFGRIDDRDQI